MKITKIQIKELLENKKDNALIDNIVGYYFGGKIVPAIITEKSILFYELGAEQLYNSEYHWDENSLVLEGLKKVSVGEEADETQESKKISISKGLFEIDEDRSSFKKSLSKLKTMIKEEAVVLNEDIFLDRMKGIAVIKAKTYLTKKESGYDNWKDEDKEYKSRQNELSNAAKNRLQQKMSERIPGREIEKFYDMYDIKKIKFSYESGSNLYKTIKLEIPKSKIWINENEELMNKQNIKYTKEMSAYSSAVGDTAGMLKKKKYVEDVEKNPSEERTSDFLSVMKRKEKEAKGFWKWNNFKSSIKEMIEDEIEVEDFINKYSILNAFSTDELKTLIEKSIINVYNSSEKLGQAKEISDTLNFMMEDQKIRENYFEELLGTPVSNTKELIAESDLGYFITAHRDPEDLTMVYVKNLAETITDYIGRYKEEAVSVDDLRILEGQLFKLNDIWARQRLTDNDKSFIKQIAESFASFEKLSLDKAQEIVAEKDRVKNSIDEFEKSLLDKNAKDKVSELQK